MDINDYKNAALRTDFKTYEDFHTGDISPRLEYGIIGLVTESAKLLDIVKKTKKSLTPQNRENVIEELGDLLWYLNLSIDELGLTYAELAQSNLEKTTKKYPPEQGDNNGLIRG